MFHVYDIKKHEAQPGMMAASYSRILYNMYPCIQICSCHTIFYVLRTYFCHLHQPSGLPKGSWRAVDGQCSGTHCAPLTTKVVSQHENRKKRKGTLLLSETSPLITTGWDSDGLSVLSARCVSGAILPNLLRHFRVTNCSSSTWCYW